MSIAIVAHDGGSPVPKAFWQEVGRALGVAIEAPSSLPAPVVSPLPPEASRETRASLRSTSKSVHACDRGELGGELRAWIGEAGDDELRVLTFIARRVVGIGQRQIGRLDLATYPKDPGVEADEEFCDSVFYLAVGALIRKR
jgi:hypothetical protein